MKIRAKLFIYIFIACFVCVNTYGQTPSIQWQKSVGGSAADAFLSVKKTTDGGSITAGFSTSNDGNITGNHGGQDLWVVKYDDTGNIQWSKLFGGTNNERANSIIQTTVGDYLVVGRTSSNDGDVIGNHGDDDIWVIKLGSNGNLQWQKCLGGSGKEDARSVIQTKDGNYLLAGVTSSIDGDVAGSHGNQEGWIVKISPAGDLIWQKCLGGSQDDFFSSVQLTNNNGFIVCGSTASDDGDVSGFHGQNDYWVVKIDSIGHLQWQKCFGGSGYIGHASDILHTSDGGYFVLGRIISGNPGSMGDVITYYGNWDFWAIKLSATGALEWQRTLGGTAYDFGNKALLTADNGYLLIGGSGSLDHDVSGTHGGNEFWAIKLDLQGITQWQLCLGGSGNEEAYEIDQISSCEYILAGATGSSDGDVSGTHGGQDAWIVNIANPLVPSVNIVSNRGTSICHGRPVTFKATSVNGGQAPVYQWKKNDQNVGINDSVYTDSLIKDGDEVSVVITSDAACVTDNVTQSNIITMRVERFQLTLTASPKVIEKGQVVTLNATANTNYKIIQWQPDYLFTDQTAASQTFLADKDLTVTVTGISGNGCTDDISINIEINPLPGLFIPNAFTPNGDGVNDVWHITGLEYETNVNIAVYNRFGRKMFEERGHGTQWDGQSNGKKLPPGVYYYIISNLNNRKPLLGWVTIIY